MKPTVGRIVHYSSETDTLAAIVTAVLEGEEDTVNLTVFGRYGQTHAEPFVRYADPPREYTWSWPPR